MTAGLLQGTIVSTIYVMNSIEKPWLFVHVSALTPYVLKFIANINDTIQSKDVMGNSG